jgi:hypothetical protein
MAPDCVCATLEQGWPRRTALARVSHVVEETPASLAAGDSPSPDGRHAMLGAALDKLMRELSEAASLRAARLDVELADSLAHIDVAAGDFAGDSDRQLHAVAAACVSELLGEAATGYDVRWQLQADDKHLLIGAVDRGLLAVLADAAERHGLRLGSVQPDLCRQWNRHAGALKPGSAVFAVASGCNAIISCVSNGAISAVGSGVWLDPEPPATLVNARVKSLMCGFGLESATTAAILDTRTDRLLASVGLDAANQSAFVLVGPEGSRKAVSSRWTVMSLEDLRS